MRNITSFGIIALGLIGCSDSQYDPNAPALDPNAPRVHITSPARGTIAGDVHSVVVTGTATDDTGVASVVVNDVPASLAADGTFTVTIPVTPGTNLLHAVAKDAQGNIGKESRAVVAGPMEAATSQVPNAMTATISAQTFDAIGRGTAGFITTGNLQALIAPHNPVLDLGGGPDCLYVQAAITSMTVHGADVTLAPQTGGLFLDAELDQVMIGMHLQYAAACINGSRDITIAASHISVSGNMTVGLINHAFDIHLDHPNVQITGFDVNFGGIPGAIIDLLHLDTAMGPILGWATEKFVVPMLNKSLAGLNNTKVVNVLGTMVNVDIAPSRVDFSSDGGIVDLDTRIHAQGDTGPGFVYVPNTVPAMDLSHGFQLAVADDVPNELLGSLWGAKGLDKTLMLKTGPYGEIGTLYDSVEIKASVPPYVDATGGSLKLTVGDLMATFKNGDSVATAVAINAFVDVKAVTGTDGQVRFDVGTPTVFVDVLDENIEGANQLSNAQFEAITSFALGRIIAVGSGSIGAIPLPTIGGVALKNLSIAEQTGYLVVGGEVQ
ncbi:MAG: hypothetical protein JWO36_1524 [Myxococcales bacterium]|nr:hypothetical protein [Myxococcales bacterium]